MQRNRSRRHWRQLAAAALTAFIVACTDGGSEPRAPSNHLPPLRNPPSFAISGTVTGLRGSGLVLENNAGDPLGVAANGTFTFATKTPWGASYAVTVRTQPAAEPAEACTVANGAGVASDAVTDVAVSCRAATTGRYVFALYNTGPTSSPRIKRLATFSIDATGALTEVPGSPFTIEIDSRSAVYLYSSGGALFVGAVTPRLEMSPLLSLTGYAIDSATGAPTPLSGPPMTQLSTNAFPFFHPSGRALYLTAGQQLRAYSIDLSNRALVPIPGSPYTFGTGNSPEEVVFDSTAALALVSFVGPSPLRGVSAFAVDPATAGLTFLGGTYRETPVEGPLVAHPTGRYAYIHPYRRLTVLGFENPVLISLSDVSLPYGRNFSGSYGLFDKAGRYAYFYSSGYDNAPSSFVPPQNAFMYGFSVDAATGALTPLSGSPFSTNGEPGGGQPSMDPSQRYIIVPNSSGATVFEVDESTGELRRAPTSPFVPVIGGAYGLVFDASGKFAFVPDSSSFSVSSYSFDSSNGEFRFVGSYPLGGSPTNVVIGGLQ